MRLGRMLGTGAAAAVAVGAAVLASPAWADSASPEPSASGSAVVTADAGTSFLNAAQLTAGQSVEVGSSTGDYQYWAFTQKAGQQATLHVGVTLADASARHGAQQWRLDLYDGLRRELQCVSGRPEVTAGQNAAEVELSCRLPRVRAYAETWSDDPLPGTYYARLTVAAANEQDLGAAMSSRVTLLESDGDARPVGGAVAPVAMPAAGPRRSPRRRRMTPCQQTGPPGGGRPARARPRLRPRCWDTP
ncbi:hypothetical protein ACFQZC_07710 [Streptacidiphilus monticola]